MQIKHGVMFGILFDILYGYRQLNLLNREHKFGFLKIKRHCHNKLKNMGNEHRFTRGTSALTGLAMNATVLIAPGAFLWVTIKMQSLYGVSMAGSGMLFGILYAIFLCIAAIICY
jgi:hypothetical protein